MGTYHVLALLGFYLTTRELGEANEIVLLVCWIRTPPLTLIYGDGG